MCIPKKAAIYSLRTGTAFALTGEVPTDEAVTFYHLPADGNRLVGYGPNTAMGGSISTGFYVKYGAG
jgi:hypothetical protein